MSEPVKQLAQNVLDHPQTAKIVSSGTITIGFSTFMNYVTPLLGATASVIGICLAILSYRNNKLRRTLLQKQIELVDRSIEEDRRQHPRVETGS